MTVQPNVIMCSLSDLPLVKRLLNTHPYKTVGNYTRYIYEGEVTGWQKFWNPLRYNGPDFPRAEPVYGWDTPTGLLLTNRHWRRRVS